MKFINLVKDYEKAGYYLQNLGEHKKFDRYRFTNMYENDKGIQITKNYTNTLEELEKILKVLTIRRTGKHEAQVVKIILNEEPTNEYSKIMTAMEKDFNIPALNDPDWNERNKDIIHLYQLILKNRELEKNPEDKIRKVLVTIFFDNDDNLEMEDRNYDRFIIETEEHNFRDRFHEIIERKRYAWDDFEKTNQGYKAIMSTETSDLSDLEVFSNDNFLQFKGVINKDIEKEDMEDDWDMEI